ncbi:MAG TPA: tetratricopeptide repeat protein [Archangium sp.]
MTEPVEFSRGYELLQQLIRGDAVIGIIPDVPKHEQQLFDSLWEAAAKEHLPAYRSLAEVYLCSVWPRGALDFCDDVSVASRPWSPQAKALTDENPMIEAGVRCFREAVRLGDRKAAVSFAKATRASTHDNQRAAAELLSALEQPTGEELTVLGNVQLWLGENEASFATQLRAAEAGNLDAQFELSLYFGQGLGVAKSEAKAGEWLQRAADGGHPRALYNLGVAFASGTGRPKSLEQAATYYQHAAELGHGRAAATLGVMILSGERPGTKDEAGDWLDDAEALGYDPTEMLEVTGLEDPRQR